MAILEEDYELVTGLLRGGEVVGCQRGFTVRIIVNGDIARRTSAAETTFAVAETAGRLVAPGTSNDAGAARNPLPFLSPEGTDEVVDIPGVGTLGGPISDGVDAEAAPPV